MVKNPISKYLAVLIILLFIGVAIAPSINQNVVKASQDDDLVEVTTQACGIQGYGDTTVKLTREQYTEFKKLFNNTQIKLDEAKTMREAISIYYNAVLELNKYGLLPKGMNVETAHKLVIGGYTHKEQTNLFRAPVNNLTNALCFIMGSLTDSSSLICYTPLTVLFSILWFPFFLVSCFLLPPVALFMIIGWLSISEMLSQYLLPFGVMNVITFGPPWFFGVTGKISTMGIYGNSSIEGEYLKGIILGFTGLKFLLRAEPEMFLGFSLYTSIKIEDPFP